MAGPNSKRIAESIREDYLTCAICCETFDTPRVLQCGHSFCLKCLKDYVKSNCSDTKRQLPCPMCRQIFSLEKAGEGEAGLMRWVENLSSDALSISVLQAIATFVPLRELESPVPALPGAFLRRTSSEPSAPSSRCLVHPDKDLEVFCSKHDQVVCAECAWREHRLQDCLCLPVSEVIERRLTAMDGLLGQQNKDTSRLLESTESGVKSMPNVKKSIKENLAEIGKAFEEMCDDFRKRLADADADVETLFENHEDILSIKSKQLELNTRMEQLTARWKHANPEHVLREISQVWNSASDFQKRLHTLSRQTNLEQLSPELGTEVRKLDSVVHSSADILSGRGDEDSEGGADMDETRLENNYVVVRNTICDPYEASGLNNRKQWVFNTKRPGEGSCTLSGIALLGNSSVVVADQFNRKLKKFKLPEGYFQAEVKLNAEPNQIATMKESSLLAVTLWDLYKVYIVSTDPGLELKMVLNTDIEYTGIASPAHNCLALSCIHKRRVDFARLDDAWLASSDNKETVSQQILRPEMVRTIHRSQFPDRLGTTSEDHVLVKNRRKRNIDCIETGADGKFIWSRRLPARVMGVACCRGRLFASLGNRNRVVHFSDSGMGPLEDLKGEVDFWRPWCMSGFKDCLVITEDSPSDRVHVFVFN